MKPQRFGYSLRPGSEIAERKGVAMELSVAGRCKMRRKFPGLDDSGRCTKDFQF